MNPTRLTFRYCILLIMTMMTCFTACGGGSENAASTTDAAAQDTAAVADTTYTVTTVAKFESGLIKLAQIGDTLALAGTGNVWIDYDGPTKEGSAEGLLAYCEGLTNRKNCSVYGTVTYNQPGTYAYHVSYTPSGLFADRVTLHGTIIVKEPGNFVVVSIGDSVASGEGSPQHFWESNHEGAYWNDTASNYNVPDMDLCHRSAYAGPAQAANKLKQTNDITFIHIACSGAHFGNEEAGDKDTQWYKWGNIGKINLQLDYVRERVPRIDVLILSGGANNIAGGFSSVITKCLLNNPFTPCSEDKDFKTTLRSSMAELNGKYDDLQTLINGGSEDHIPSVVAITEYFDPTRDSDGNFPSALLSFACIGGSVSPKEWAFLYDEMVVPLNAAGKSASERLNWVHVGGIADAFRNHGYCASLPGDLLDKSWVIKLVESGDNQLDVAGTAHPDLNGQAVYREHIYSEIVKANPPRTTASGISGGQPYTFGDWTAGEVEVTLHASNPIKESGVRETYYGIDEPQCNATSVNTGACLPYVTPITLTDGRHTVSFFSYNQFGAPETKVKPVEVLIDNEPPVMTCSAAPDEVWPPNKRMVGITVTVTADDAVSGPADYVLVNITDSAGDVNNAVQDFVIGTNDTQGMVLADRTGYGGNRYYTLTYQSEDHVGNVGTCDVIVQVPHDQGNN